MSLQRSDFEDMIIKIDMDEFKKNSSIIVDHVVQDEVVIDLYPVKLIVGVTFTKEEEEAVAKELGLAVDKFRDQIALIGHIMRQIIKDDGKGLTSRILKKDEKLSGKLSEIISFIKNQMEKCPSIKQKYLLRLYSKVQLFKHVEWDVQTKYYHSDYKDEEMIFPMAMIRLIFETPLSIEEGGVGNDITFEVSETDIVTLKNSLIDLEKKIRLLSTKIEV